MSGASLRPFPYPFQAALAISNDADLMSFDQFRLTHRYLSGRRETPLGQGLGLDVSASMFLFSSPDSPNRFTLCSGLGTAPSSEASLLCQLAHAGIIDTLHTYGDFSSPDHFSRDLAKRGLEELDRLGIKLEIWINHGGETNPQNLGVAERHHFLGDDPASPFYHADITKKSGFRFCWIGSERSDSIGQGSRTGRPHLGAEVRAGLHRLRQGKVPSFGLSRKLLRPHRLRDGTRMLSFTRFAGVGLRTPVLDDLPQQLSDINLNDLVERQGYCILYQHFGVRRVAPGFGASAYAPNKPPYYKAEELEAFGRLARAFDSGRILVTGTRNLLRYHVAHQGLNWYTVRSNQGLHIVLTGIREPDGEQRQVEASDIGGITFYCDDPMMTRLVLRCPSGDREVSVIPNGPDGTGRKSVSVPLKRSEPLDL